MRGEWNQIRRYPEKEEIVLKIIFQYSQQAVEVVFDRFL
jgi:hypothetical protein